MSHRNRLIFIKTRKTAGTSFEIALSRNAGPGDIVTRLTREDEVARVACGGRGPQNERIPIARWRRKELLRARYGSWPVFSGHMSACEVRRILPRSWDEYLTLTIVRNPWDVVVSAYWWYRGRHAAEATTLSDFISSPRVTRFVCWPMIADGSAIIVDQVVRFESLRDRSAGVIRSDRGSIPRISLTLRVSLGRIAVTTEN